MWKKIPGKFVPNIGASKIRLCKQFAECELDYATINPEKWTTGIELLRGDLKKIDVNIDNL